ncbi:hypothetical protein ACFFJX_08025 [Pseudarcicella hirudinis]|uniref:hypothetical protein n=1 Tax=Pseudarcicella hirudinis TaxID=1079859 RepID=UPI0035E80745
MANYSYNGNGDLQLFGKGADIWQDQTQYNWYCKKESNVDIDQVCLVESQQNTNSFAKAGCLIHNGMPSVAAHAAIWICIVPNGSIVVLSKASNGQVQQLKSVDGKAVPVWLRVQKTGLSVKLYYSTDSPTTTAIAWVLLHEVQNFFSGFGTDYWHGVWLFPYNRHDLRNQV